MIIWLILANIACAIILRRNKILEYSTKTILYGAFAISLTLVIFTILCTSKSYTTEPVHIILPKANVRIIDDSTKNYMMVATNKDDTYYVKHGEITKYMANSKEDEVVELLGEKRVYTPMVPDVIYALYYLRLPHPESTTVISHMNLSEYKPQ